LSCSSPLTRRLTSPAQPLWWTAVRPCPKAPTSASTRAKEMTREGRLHNRVSLVTGAARGIGLAAARALAQEGARVMMCDVDADVLEIAADELLKDGLRVQAARADVANRDSMVRAIEATVAAWGQLDVLVSNAAIGDD